MFIIFNGFTKDGINYINSSIDGDFGVKLGDVLTDDLIKQINAKLYSHIDGKIQYGYQTPEDFYIYHNTTFHNHVQLTIEEKTRKIISIRCGWYKNTDDSFAAFKKFFYDKINAKYGAFTFKLISCLQREFIFINKEMPTRLIKIQSADNYITMEYIESYITKEKTKPSLFALSEDYIVDNDKEWLLKLESEKNIYLLPYIEKNKYPIIQGPYQKGKIMFSHLKDTPDENAIDIAMPIGTTIRAIRDGIVVDIKQDEINSGQNKKFKANYVILYHGDKTFTKYLHLKTKSVVVKIGQKVKAGESLAQSGNIGYSTVPHLHFSAFYKIIEKNIEVEKSLTMNFIINNKVVTLKEGDIY